MNFIWKIIYEFFLQTEESLSILEIAKNIEAISIDSETVDIIPLDKETYDLQQRNYSKEEVKIMLYKVGNAMREKSPNYIPTPFLDYEIDKIFIEFNE